MRDNGLMKVWCYGTVNGKPGLVVGNVAVKNMEEARQMARRWNRGNRVTQIEIVQNALEAREATAVSAIG